MFFLWMVSNPGLVFFLWKVSNPGLVFPIVLWKVSNPGSLAPELEEDWLGTWGMKSGSNLAFT